MLNIVNNKPENNGEKGTRKSISTKLINKERVEVSSLKNPKQMNAAKKVTKKQESKKIKIKIPPKNVNKTIVSGRNDSLTSSETNKIQSFVPSDSDILKRGLVTPADSVKQISALEKLHPEIINNPIKFSREAGKTSSNNAETNEISLDTASSTMTSQSLQRMIEHEATFFSDPRDFGRIILV